MLKFWVRRGIFEQEVLIPPEALPMLERVAVHDAGHAVVAVHFGADVLGIAFALEPAGFRAMAVYSTPPPYSIDDISVIYAAGSAGEQLVYGDYGDVGASGDLKDLERAGATIDYPTRKLLQQLTDGLPFERSIGNMARMVIAIAGVESPGCPRQ